MVPHVGYVTKPICMRKISEPKIVRKARTVMLRKKSRERPKVRIVGHYYTFIDYNRIVRHLYKINFYWQVIRDLKTDRTHKNDSKVDLLIQPRSKMRLAY